jgi:hypothetical protein
MIKFLCPNGHQLSAPENLAGKPGKCPKCNTAFVVPTPEEDADLEPPGVEPATPPTAAVAPQPNIGMGSGKGKGAPKDAFVFLCPNGHKLNGPPSLKGRPGQCPHCNARFIIPTDEDIAAAEQADDADDDDELAAETGIDNDSVAVSHLAKGSAVNNRPPAGPSGLGYIVARLWDQRSEQTELEIFLSEGEIVAPDYFSESLSTSDYGVFAVQEGEAFTITVIPWSTVRRVGLRRLGELPGGLFE